MAARRDSALLQALEKCIEEVPESEMRQLSGEAASVLLKAKGAPAGTVVALCRLHPELPALLLDVACVLDAAADNAEERADLTRLLKEAETALSDKLLKERMEIDTLQDVGTLKNKNFYTKFIKIKTKLYYKQRKFNLFREESEGYAKLVVELNQDVGEIVDSKSVLEIIKSLIGRFNLDPNRVLDIILESFESRYENEDLFIPLIKSYMSDPQIVCEVLGFKFAAHSDESAPHGLYVITALLLQHDIISLDDIYSWLKPDDSIIWRESEQEMQDAQEYVRRMTIICTNKQPGDVEPTDPKDNFVEPVTDLGNQKLRLGAALLEVGCWNVFHALSARLPEYRASAYPPATKALCAMLHSIIHPLYTQHCPIAPNIKSKPMKQLTNKLAVPPVKDWADLRQIVIPALATLGPALQNDSVLMYKIVRICKTARSLEDDPLRHDILSILDSAILPALSYMDCNCCMAEEVYSLLKLYPYQYRYCLYARWKNEAPLRHASLLRRRADAQRQIKAIMKRVSKENVKPQGRLIGKLSHAAPAFFFDYVLLQIQIYDNLIGPVVESLKYLTSLSYDMLGYCLVEALGGGRRARVQPDGASAAPWLQGLAAFCGAACKKYAIDLTALLQFVANQLKAKKSLDLLILKEIVQKMAGIEAAEEMTAEQLDAMSGGELLRGEAGYFSQVRNTKKSSQRLKEALMSGGEGLDAALCLLAAQQRQCCAYREDGAEGAPRAHLKLVGRLIDQCQDALVQFGVFLATTHTHDEYSSRLPSIESMLEDYHIGADVAFFLARPALSWSITARYEKLRRENIDGKRVTAATKQQRYTEAASMAMAPIVSAIICTLPSKVWDDISPEFYVTFWSLTMYDLQVPTESYKREIDRLKALASSAGSENNSSSSSNVTKGRKEHERYNTLIEKLQDEKRKQQEHVERVMYRLQQEKDTWFLSRSSKYAKNETITQFMQLCLFPRCLFTAMDAIYCAHFLHTLHSFKTANFPTLLCYDRLFCDITYTVTCLTEGEAARYGRFLEAVLATAMHWRSDESVFQRECAHYPGFVTKFRVSNKFSDANDHVGYVHFRHVCHKWHFKITKAMLVCLDSRDYVQIRNSLIVLIRILPQFPILTKLSQVIAHKIEKVRDEEKNHRQDLFILATSYSGQLKARASSMLRDEDFHKMGSGEVPDTLNNSSSAVNGDSQNDKDTRRETGKDRKPSKISDTSTEKDSKRDSNQQFKGGNIERRSEGSKDWEGRNTAKTVTREDDLRRKDRISNERNYREERFSEISPATGVSNNSDEISLLTNASNNISRIQQETSERDMKRRKIEENSTIKGNKDRERDSSPNEKRTRGGSKSAVTVRSSSSSKLRGPEDREARKERKLGRKRDRTDETVILEQKRRRDDQKGHQNGDQDDHHAEKHHHKREKSPYRDRSHERQDSRDKHRRSNENKLRR
ncbi:THO complex subunit 2-like protein isoform X2 [Arctopsyche grandis]|uniref:THO complex subunit 2-like protein isoform X2 n=1 Tax=Arctopsyche grandis TaxID=121162 RepID=UPI00406D8D8E